MTKIKVAKAFERIAVRNGVSVAKIREEIEKAIEIGLKSPDPIIREQWSRIPHQGEKPTPE